MDGALGMKSSTKDLLQFFRCFMTLLKGEKYLPENGAGRNASKPRTDLGKLFGNAQELLSESSCYEIPALQSDSSSYLRFSKLEACAAGLMRGTPIPSSTRSAGESTGLTPEPIYFQHGILPGSSASIYMIPTTQMAIIVLQNSTSAHTTSTASFVAQLLMQAILFDGDPKEFKNGIQEQLTTMYQTSAGLEPGKYVYAPPFVAGEGGADRIQSVPDSIGATQAMPKDTGASLLQLGPSNSSTSQAGTSSPPAAAVPEHTPLAPFHIDIIEQDGALQLQLMGKASEAFKLLPQGRNEFRLDVSYDFFAERGRLVPDDESFASVSFKESEGKIESFRWNWSGREGGEGTFVRDDADL
ncbi:hypothetical protein BJ508DRAFT_360884 [Ascobolus immersus RN42]|uniref:Beta-lactamase/transpeptidase-like protein n=1 Tax=Ascobolus immersus RN42 TaxID=1160509 RepID=A0A3N4IBW9_ASCIM|nr:hypothetical protein BJ508DRAFT_360884 [Ascobolus immersus RN42]